MLLAPSHWDTIVIMIEPHKTTSTLLNLTIINVGAGLQFHQLDRNLNPPGASLYVIH